MADIFVCYRRADSRGDAGRLADSLDERFAETQVFRDVESLEAGTDYKRAIETAIGGCVALLAVIGPRWLDMRASDGSRRLDNPEDFIRLEIGTALEQGIKVIPVLVGGAPMPPAKDLPGELKPLAAHQAVEISDSRWDYDVDRLADALEKLPGLRRPFWRRLRARPMWVKAPVAMLGLLLGLAVLTQMLTGGKDPVLDPQLQLLDVNLLSHPDAESNCLHPLDCDSKPDRKMSSMVRLTGADVRHEPGLLHLVLTVHWVLREGETNVAHRGYTGKLYYTAAYQHSAATDRVVIGEFDLSDHTLAPHNGLLAYTFGWVEVPFLQGRDTAITSEIKRRLAAAPAVQALR